VNSFRMFDQRGKERHSLKRDSDSTYPQSAGSVGCRVEPSRRDLDLSGGLDLDPKSNPRPLGSLRK
jgi:hypothetical protein